MMVMGITAGDHWKAARMGKDLRAGPDLDAREGKIACVQSDGVELCVERPVDSEGVASVAKGMGEDAEKLKILL